MSQLPGLATVSGDIHACRRAGTDDYRPVRIKSLHVAKIQFPGTGRMDRLPVSSTVRTAEYGAAGTAGPDHVGVDDAQATQAGRRRMVDHIPDRELVGRRILSGYNGTGRVADHEEQEYGQPDVFHDRLTCEMKYVS